MSRYLALQFSLQQRRDCCTARVQSSRQESAWATSSNRKNLILKNEVSLLVFWEVTLANEVSKKRVLHNLDKLNLNMS